MVSSFLEWFYANRVELAQKKKSLLVLVCERMSVVFRFLLILKFCQQINTVFCFCAEICVKSCQVEKCWFSNEMLFHCSVSTGQKAGAIATLDDVPVRVRAFLVKFNLCFHFSMAVECNPQHNNSCV